MTDVGIGYEPEPPKVRRTSPYFGLDYYDERFGEWLFGREAERNRIITNLRAARLTLLHAHSGVGKSSLLRAGVAWQLDGLARQGVERRGRARYIPVVFSEWKDDPVSSLVDAIEDAVNKPFGARAENGAEPKREKPIPPLPREHLDEAIREAAGAVDASLLVILDQFEEYFLYAPNETPPERLADELARCINQTDLPASFLISIREDAYARLGDLLQGRISNVYGNYLHIDYLGHDAAEAAIRKPLAVYNKQPGVEPVEIEDELVRAVLNGVHQVRPGDANGDAPDEETRLVVNGHADDLYATPLLQLVMQTVWERERAEHSSRLRLSTLEKLEGPERILDTHLNKALAALANEDERQVAIDAFDRLVTPSGAKIAESICDLAKQTGHSEEQVARTLEKLERPRILRPVPPPPGKDPGRFRRYEIFHDVLAPAINRVVAAREEARRTHRARRLAALAGGLLLVAAAVIGIFVYLWNEAESDKARAQSVAAAASAEEVRGSNPELGVLLALDALKSQPTRQAQQALRDVLPTVQEQRSLSAPPPAVEGVFSPDGASIAGAFTNGTVGIWNTANHRLEGTLGVAGLSGLNSVAFSRNGKLIATAYGNGTVRIWDARTRRQLGDVIPGSEGSAWSASFNPAGTRVAIADTGGTAKIFEVSNHRLVGLLREPPLPGQTESLSLYKVAWSPDGRLIVTASLDGAAQIWSVADLNTAGTATPVGELNPGQHVAVETAEFSPDGSQILTASGDGNAETWNVGRALQHAGAKLHTIAAGSTGLNDARFSANGKLIVTAGRTGALDVWSASTDSKSPLMSLRRAGQPASVLSAAFNPNDTSVLSAGGDGSLRIWDLRGRKETASLTGPAGSDSVSSAVFSPDGSRVLTGTYGGSARLWSAATGQSQLVFTTPHGYNVTDVSFSPDGRLFAASDGGGHAWICSADTGEIEAELNWLPQIMSSIEFNPTDSSRVVTASADGTAQIWNLNNPSTPERVLGKRGEAAVNSAAFSPDGRLVVTARQDGKATVWSATGHREGRTVSESGSALYGAHFSPDGAFIVTAGHDGGAARVWNWKTGHQADETLSEPGGAYMTDAQFSPASTPDMVATSSSDGTARIWNIVSGRQLLTLVGDTGPVASVAFNHDGSRVVTASADGTARLWGAYPSDEVGAPLNEPGGADLATAFFDRSGDRLVTASSDGTARIYEAASHKQVAKLVEPSGQTSVGHGLASAQFSPNGKLVVTASEDGTARIWSATTGEEEGRPLGREGGSPVRSAFFSPSGRQIVTAAEGQGEGTARVWNVETHQPEGTAMVDKEAAITWAAFSPDGTRIVTSDGGSARIWDWKTGQQRGFTISVPPGVSIIDAWFSPSGRYVVTCSDDGIARVWSTSTSIQLASVTEPGGAPMFNAVLGPHEWLLTSSADGYARIWDWKTGQLLTSLAAGEKVFESEFSADGRLVATASEHGTARIFSTKLAGPLGEVEAIARARVKRSLTKEERRIYLGG